MKESYSVEVTEDPLRVTFKGTLRLQGRPDYEKILATLRDAARRAVERFEIDLRELQFLNSSGISTLSVFLIEMRETGTKITISAAKAVPWQRKALDNFSRLSPHIVANLV